jgi:hypothetical protein
MIKIKNIEITEEELRRIIKENPQVTTENKERKFFEPKRGEGYFFLLARGVDDTTNDGDYRDGHIIARGVYRTEAEAIQADNIRLAIKRVWDSADNKWYFRPGWNDEKQMKHFPLYNHEDKQFIAEHRMYTQHNPFLPYFKSSTDCLAFAKENEKDLRIIWGV